LGSLIADCLGDFPETEKIFYICGKTAVRPGTKKAQVLVIEDTAELEAAVRDVFKGRRIDGIIHSMAVSDYRVQGVTSPKLLAATLLEALGNDPGASPDPDRIARIIREAPGMERDGKLSSDEKNLILFLEPTVKVISLFRELAPETLLVGFKLLDRVPYAALIDAAHGLLLKNHCTYVLANDAEAIHGGRHVGYLVDREKNVIPYEGKEAIARGVASQVIRDLTP
jgi:phosphopantothenate-cysteine ligase